MKRRAHGQENDKQLKFCCAGQGVRGKALQEGGYHFLFFSKVQQPQTMRGTVTSNSDTDSVSRR